MPRYRPLPELSEKDRERFLSSFEVSPSGCHTWTKGRFSEGYGAFSVGKDVFRAHRIAYALANGDPGELTIDHLCHAPETCAGGFDCPHRSCVNPDRRGRKMSRANVLRGGGLTAKNAAKSRCDSGHEFTEENTYVDPRGWRQCRTCNREKAGPKSEEDRDRVNARRRELRPKVVHEERECAHPACTARFVPERATGIFCKEPECVRRRARERRLAGKLVPR